MSEQSSPRNIRWWPLWLLCLGYLANLVWIWAGEDAPDRQNQVIFTLLTGLLLGVAAVIWALFFGRLPNQIRRLVGIVAVVVALTSAATVEIRGFSGDLVPILAWRWSPHLDDQLEARTVEAAGREEIPTTPNDYPRFLGPDGYGRLPGPKLARDWQAHPPEELWRQEIGAGWSSFAVVNDHAVTMEQRGDLEMVVCYNLHNGEMIWSHADETRFSDTLSGDGPRATPFIAHGLVYTLGATGHLNCLELATGRKIWSRNILRDNKAESPPFGVATSPLVDGDLVLIAAGGENGRSLVAYDRLTGDLAFSGGDAPGGYSTPVRAILRGVPQYLVFNGKGLAAHDVNDGHLLWTFAWPDGSEHVSQPIVLPGNRVFLSSGYGVGGRLLQVDVSEGKWTAEKIYETPRLKAKFTNVIHRDGYLYALDDGVLACVSVEDGQRKWKRGRYGHGQIMMVGDLILVTSERGELFLVDIDPETFKEYTHFQAVEGKTWNHSALVGDLLLVRNHREVVCLRLPVEG